MRNTGRFYASVCEVQLDFWKDLSLSLNSTENEVDSKTGDRRNWTVAIWFGGRAGFRDKW